MMWYCPVCKDLHNDKEICLAGASRPMNKNDLIWEVIEEIKEFEPTIHHDHSYVELIEQTSRNLKDWAQRLTDIMEGRLPFKTMGDELAQKMGIDHPPSRKEYLEWKVKNPDA